MGLYTWNVRSLYRNGALRQLTDILTKYKADITATQEMRWTNSGILHKNNFDIYYSCDKKVHALGVGFVVGRRLKQQIIDWRPVSQRICVIRIKSKFHNISLINAHAPTEEKDEDEKDAFYDALDRAHDKCPRNDIKIIAGDLNAKIGREEFHQRQTGKHSLHVKSNENGLRGINFAASKNMVVGSTMFPRKDNSQIHVGFA